MFWRKKPKKIDFLKAHEKFGDLVKSLHRHTRKKKNFFPMFLKGLAFFILVIVILSLIISGFLFFKFKNFYDLALAGKDGLQNSINAAKQKDFSGMEDNSTRAKDSFAALAAELDLLRNNIILKNLKIGDKELADIDSLVRSAGLVSKALAETAVIGGQFDKISGGQLGTNFSQFTPEEKQSILKWIYESGPEFNGLKADLDLAALNLNNVQADGLLVPFRGKIEDVKGKLNQASDVLSKAVLVSRLLPAIAGYPKESTFLILFQNNDELRPTGGFLGTYGILQTENGDIARFDTHDIYHMDMPMEANNLLKIVPPAPIAKYLNRNWYMRDSNWSPDWPSSAKQIVWFYNKENALLPAKNQINDFNGDFDGVIGITPDLVSSLLDLTGPVTVNSEQFNSGNFTKLLQYKVEQDLAAQNVTSWQRKEIIGKILEEMKKKLFNLDYRQWPAALDKLNKAVAEKNILFFLKDEGQENLAKDLEAGGEIKAADGDYLMLVDSNMAALKTDAVMQKSLAYQIEQRVDGLYGKLKVIYLNSGTKDWRTDDYKSYTRIYLPQGSELVSADGFVYEKAKTYDELGKTVVAGFIIVRLGKSTEINLEYKLPKNLADEFSAGSYDLYWQKQPGNRIKSVKVDVKALNEIKSYSPAEDAVLSGNNIIWTSGLKTDKEFKIMIND
jgi:hypothetical protein